MSTIYRYLDVLSVEKCIDNINDFIKIKYIFIIMSALLRTNEKSGKPKRLSASA